MNAIGRTRRRHVKEMWSKREIARVTGLSRNSIRKMAAWPRHCPRLTRAGTLPSRA